MATKRKAAISDLIKSDMAERFAAPAPAKQDAVAGELPKTEKAPEPVKKDTAHIPQTAPVPKIDGDGAAFFKYIADEVEGSPLFNQTEKKKFYDYMLSQAKRSVHDLQTRSKNGFCGSIVIMLRKNQF
jgi:hypothetical protein